MDPHFDTSSGAGERGDAEALRHEAIGWIVRLTSGEATAEDAAQLKAWRARSAAHEEAFRRASLAWRRMGASAGARRPAPSRRLFLAGAGMALAAGWAGVALGRLAGLDQLLSDYATGVGQQARLLLPDGSSLDLDGASAVDARFTPTARDMRLIAGAAAFDVVADGRPFQVTAGPGVVSAISAAFAVSMSPDATRVECLRGTVEAACGEVATLTAGERLRFDARGLSAPEPLIPAAATPWRRGLLVFEDRPLSEVVADINRHRPGRILLARPGLGGRRVNGVFHLARPDEIVDNLVGALGLSETRLPGGIAILL